MKLSFTLAALLFAAAAPAVATDQADIRHGRYLIATYAKSGTTWTQQIVAQMHHGGDPALAVAEFSPWLDLRVPPKEVKLPSVEAQTQRRILKTHLPLDALVFSPKAKYLYIGRDGRDVLWSMYNHHVNANADWYAALNDTPGRVAPPSSRRLPTSVTTGTTGWRVTAIRSGRSGNTCAAGGRSASCQM